MSHCDTQVLDEGRVKAVKGPLKQRKDLSTALQRILEKKSRLKQQSRFGAPLASQKHVKPATTHHYRHPKKHGTASA